METPEIHGPGASAGAERSESAGFRCDALVVDDHAVVTVRGELDLATAPTVLTEVLGTLAPPVTDVVVDLRDVSFLDSSGLGALIAAYRGCVECGTTLTLESVPNHARRVIEITGVAELFGLAPNREAR